MKIIDYFIDPTDKQSLRLEGDSLCSATGQKYAIKDGIFCLLPKNSDLYVEHYKTDAELFDYFAQSNDKVNLHDEHRLRQYISKIAGQSLGDLLDVGSGGGWVAGMFGNKAQTITFSDISFHNLSEIKKRHNLPNANYVQLDSLNMPFQSNCFDTIIASEVIEHTPDPQAFIHNLFNLLKPNGKLIISTPYKEKLQYYLCIHCNKPTPKNAHLHSFDEFKLLDMLDKSTMSAKYHKFGNKLLIFSRSYILLQYMPFALWRLLDRLANLIFPKQAHIIIEIVK